MRLEALSSRKVTFSRPAHLRPSAWPGAAGSVTACHSPAYRRKPLRSSRGRMFAKVSNHADGL